mmetsp:Transcript_2581/g.6846  ORF Transcript_2581/g.6846 Transcript_2581/m.6846 type:complete len:202 (-) Transcript_2581:239-844(-)
MAHLKTRINHLIVFQTAAARPVAVPRKNRHVHHQFTLARVRRACYRLRPILCAVAIDYFVPHFLVMKAVRLLDRPLHVVVSNHHLDDPQHAPIRPREIKARIQFLGHGICRVRLVSLRDNITRECLQGFEQPGSDGDVDVREKHVVTVPEDNVGREELAHGEIGELLGTKGDHRGFNAGFVLPHLEGRVVFGAEEEHRMAL